MKHIWELSFEEFKDRVRVINHKQYAEDYFRLGKMHCVGCSYYLFFDENLEAINPTHKKHYDKKVIQIFRSTFSREDVLEQAYDWVIRFAKVNGLYDI